MGGDIRKFSQLFADINVNYSVDRITNNLSEMKLQKYPVFKLSIIETICNTHVCPLKRYSDC